MPHLVRAAPILLVLAAGVLLCGAEVAEKKHHHHHKHHRHHKHHHDGGKHHGSKNSTVSPKTDASKHGVAMKQAASPDSSPPASKKVNASEHNASEHNIATHQATPPESLILHKMKQLEKDLSSHRRIEDLTLQKAHLKVNAPLPNDFPQLFSRGISLATGCKPTEVKVISSKQMSKGKVDEVTFEAPRFAAHEAERQAADPDSKLAKGPIGFLLMAREDDGEKEEEEEEAAATPTAKEAPETAAVKEEDAPASKGNGIDIDTEMPFGDLEPFGREDTAQELTESAIEESNRMVDQLERAEVAEEKRAVFRALTRLRGAAITSFDGVARSQTGNIDEYNKMHKWREAHPLHHLAEEESDISKWAFPEVEF